MYYKKRRDIAKKIIKNIIYPTKLTANTLIKSKIIINNIFQKCSFNY